MTNKNKCAKCKGYFKSIDEETQLCFYCHLNKFGKIAKFWQPRGKYVQ